MKNLHSRITYIIIAVFLIGCNKKEAIPEKEEIASSKTSVSVTPEQFKSIGIQLGKVESRMLSGTVSVSGMLDVPPQNLVNITAPFGGFLRSTSLLQGMKVAKGQSIAVIENPEYVQLQQDYLEAKSQVGFLETEFQRQQELAKENVNSQKILQKSSADLNSMKAKYSGLRVKLGMLGIDPDKLNPASMRSTIELHSPINGYVTHINSGVGSFVNPVDVIFQIVDTEHLHAELTAFERDIPKIKIGQLIRFTLSNEAVERTARVYLVGREISQDRTVRIHGHIDKEDRELIPGMYLKATIETDGEAVSSLPEEAVVNYEDKSFIFVTEGDQNHFNLVEVGTGIRENGFIEIIPPSSLNNQNTPVVVKGAYKLLSKMKNGEEDE